MSATQYQPHSNIDRHTFKGTLDKKNEYLPNLFAVTANSSKSNISPSGNPHPAKAH